MAAAVEDSVPGMHSPPNTTPPILLRRRNEFHWLKTMAILSCKALNEAGVRKIASVVVVVRWPVYARRLECRERRHLDCLINLCGFGSSNQKREGISTNLGRFDKL